MSRLDISALGATAALGAPAALGTKIRFPQIPAGWLAEQWGAQAAPAAKATKALKDPDPKQRLIQRATLGWTPGEQALVDEIGFNTYLDRQLDYESLDDSPLEEALHDALPTLSMTPFELVDTYAEDEPQIPFVEMTLATFLRSFYSPRQLYERMVMFWTDHFNIDALGDFGLFLKPPDHRDVIRRHAMGTFPDLLRASAHSPAMLVYLTNDSNVKEHPNENYARELMELHTLGADRGYTQEDVREVSRALTGWTVKGFEFGRKLGEFLFNDNAHDKGEKTVLGRTIPADGGIRDGERVLNILARHRNTADLVARKMLTYLWGYDPPQHMVDKVADKYLDTEGDIREMLRVILRPAWMTTATAKLKRPYHVMTSAVRVLGSDVREEGFGFIFDWLYNAGHLPYTWSPPNGFPDSEVFWASYVIPRWNLSAEILTEAVHFDVPVLDPERNPKLNRAALRSWIDRNLLGSRMSAQTKKALREFQAALPMDAGSVAETLGLALASPDFQYY